MAVVMDETLSVFISMETFIHDPSNGYAPHVRRLHPSTTFRLLGSRHSNMSTFQHFSGSACRVSPHRPASEMAERARALWRRRPQLGRGLRRWQRLNGDGCSATARSSRASCASGKPDVDVSGSMRRRVSDFEVHLDNASSSLTWNEVAVEQDRFESNFGNDGWSGWEMDDAVEVMCTGVGFPSP